jgi:hypothetical protein
MTKYAKISYPGKKVLCGILMEAYKTKKFKVFLCTISLIMDPSGISIGLNEKMKVYLFE